MIMRQLHEGRADIEIAYARGVMPEGNPVALAAIDEVFETCTALWRGLGEIPGSGYRIREEFAQFDAVRRFQPTSSPRRIRRAAAAATCFAASCANECPLFRKVCTPENPVVLAWCQARAAAPLPPVLLKRKQALQHPKDPRRGVLRTILMFT